MAKLTSQSRAGVRPMPEPIAASTVVGPKHDHHHCVETLLDRARKTFDEKGLKLTALRLRVLEEIAASHDAMGAYDVLDRLVRKGGDKLAPISVYRAIDALLEAGLVHRLESKNAFFACHSPHAGTQRHMALVCDRCAKVVEVPATGIYHLIEKASESKGFALRAVVAEGAGLCSGCAAEPPAPAA